MMRVNLNLVFKGFSLLELLLSLTLSLLILLGILFFYGYIQRGQQDIFLRLQLQADLQGVIQVISKDLRRAGYQAASNSVAVSNFDLFTPKDTNNVSSVIISRANNEMENSCVLFWYDLDGNGCLGKYKKEGICKVNQQNNTTDLRNELFGYRLNKKMIETRLMYSNAVNVACQGDECRQYLSDNACSQNSGWTDLLDEGNYVISKFAFTWIAQKKGIEILLEGYLKQRTDIKYEVKALVPLLNEI